MFEALSSHPVRLSADDRLALVVCLEVEGHRFTVANTHLSWQPPGTERSEHLGRAQLLKLLDLLAKSPCPENWLVAGDLNATSDSVVIQAAEGRGLRLSCRSQRPWDTTCINGRRRKIDYVLHLPGFVTPTPHGLSELTAPMPSLKEPSDHLPLVVGLAGNTVVDGQPAYSSGDPAPGQRDGKPSQS